MNWIDESQRETGRRRERERLLAENENDVYGQLWDEISKCLTDAREHVPGLTTNGQPLSRTVLLPAVIRGLGPTHEMLKVSLDSQTHEIVAQGSRVNVRLKIDIDKDNIACLRVNGLEVSLKTAAEKVLKPFLFPLLAD
jgi:hypothetical protein